MSGVLLDQRSGRPVERSAELEWLRAWREGAYGPKLKVDRRLRSAPDHLIERAIRAGLVTIDDGWLVPAAGAADIGIGVTDNAPGAGIADIRARQRTVGGVTNAVEQYVLAISDRVDSGVYHAHSGTLSVLAAAHGATAGFAFLVNRSAAQMVALRRVEFIETPSAVTSFATLPRVTMERFTFTGTPSAGLVTPTKHVKTTQNGETLDATNIAEFRTASTGLTNTAGEVVYAFLVRPVLAAFATGSQVEPTPVPEIWYPEEGEGVILANGEGILWRQADAGSTSDTRKFHLDVTWEEYVLP